MPLTTPKQRPVWASNVNYASGSAVGNPTKVAPLNLDIADGARPGEQAEGEKYNYVWNDWDALLLKLRSLSFVTKPVTTLANMADVKRYQGRVLAVSGSNVINSLLSDQGGGASVSYTGEGSTARFQYLAVDDSGNWTVAGKYSSGGSVATGAFGVWTVNGDTGVATPLVHTTHATPWTAPTSTTIAYLVQAYGGKTYAFLTPGSASNSFVRINPGTDPDFYTMFLDGDDSASTQNLGRIAGYNTSLIHVYIRTGTNLLTYDIGLPASPWQWNIHATTINVSAHGHPLNVKYVAGLGCYVIIMADGTVYGLGSGASGEDPTMLQPGTGHTYVAARPTEYGWMAYAAETSATNPAGKIYYSPDYVNVYQHDADPAGVANALRFMHDGESFWLETVTAGSFARTLPIL